jgi:hypothetical protein
MYDEQPHQHIVKSEKYKSTPTDNFIPSPSLEISQQKILLLSL